MTYFELYDIPVSFLPDANALKKKFYKLSKKYHPDFYTLASEEKQQESLELSSLNNEAYKVLTDLDKRVKYILDIREVMKEEGKNKLSPSFLMDMMEVNEAIMDLQFDPDPEGFKAIEATVQEKETNLYDSVALIFENYDDKDSTLDELNAVKDYYLKKKYLVRIKENLAKIG